MYRRTDILAQNFYAGETGMPMKGSAEMQIKVRDGVTALRDICIQAPERIAAANHPSCFKTAE